MSILSKHRCHLGEGPAYDAATDTAWWFDIVERGLFEARLATGEVRSHALPFMASVLSYIDNQRQLVFGEDGLFVRDIASGKLDLHTPIEKDKPATRSNDGRVHPSGAMWIATMGRRCEPGLGTIYRFFAGELTCLYTGLAIPNAICFSPDGGTAYFTDTCQNVMLRVSIDPETAAPTGEPRTLYGHSGVGGLDGSVVDVEGLIWNARWGASCVDAYTPEGQRVRTVRVPARQPTCPVFVGAAFDRLLVTSAWQGMDDDARRDDPDHGFTFILDAVAKGRPEPRVRLAA